MIRRWTVWVMLGLAGLPVGWALDSIAQNEAWSPMGISGGGALYTPAINPADPREIMINCDMSAAYLSTNGGRSWRMIHHAQLSGNTFCRPAFHPDEPGVIYAASGWSGRLKVSRDHGKTWHEIGNLPAGLRGEIAMDPSRPAIMLAGTQNSVWRSTDGGNIWMRSTGPKGSVLGFHFDQSSPLDQRICFAATDEGVWRSEDGGATWVDARFGLPAWGLRAFVGASNARDSLCMLYAVVPSRQESGLLVGGIYRSSDRGASWESAMGDGINRDVKAADSWAMGPIAQYHFVLAADPQPNTVYALNANTGVKPPHHATVYRSDDAGRTWRATFNPDARFQQVNVAPDWRTAGAGQFYQEKPLGAAICSSDPKRLFFCGSMGCYFTEDGGVSWLAGHAQPAPNTTGREGAGSRWVCNGLTVTTAWHYYVDPFEISRHYIAYTDIGFARSLDAGCTWTWWDRKGWAPWANTCYELAFDPERPGKIWGAFSNTHDIPNANIISGRHRENLPGGVCVSLDFGVTWQSANEGLPAAPVTALLVAAGGKSGARTLYAGVFNYGVYRSVDDGQTWQPTGQQPGSKINRRVCRLALHKDGTLFVLVTAKREGEGRKRFIPDGPGLYRSADNGSSWEWVNASQPLLWPKDFAVDPSDARILYIAACDLGHGNEEGGLYRSADGGSSWERILRKGPQHFGAYLHPAHPGWVYATLCEGAPGPGLWLSCDNGKTWSGFYDLPFRNIQRVLADPAAPDKIILSTFGGSVWRGPAMPGG